VCQPCNENGGLLASRLRSDDWPVKPGNDKKKCWVPACTGDEWGLPLRLPQPLRKQMHGLAVDLGAVPRAHDLEILGALAERRAGAHAVFYPRHLVQ